MTDWMKQVQAMSYNAKLIFGTIKSCVILKKKTSPHETHIKTKFIGKAELFTFVPVFLFQ